MKKKTTIEKIYDYLIDFSIATEEEVQLVVQLNGYKEKTLLDILYARTGYRSIEQYDESAWD